MKRIYKYTINMQTGSCEIPGDSKILMVENQHGKPCIWVETDTAHRGGRIKVMMVGTGDFVPRRSEHIGSVMLHDGEYVFHVYRLVEN